ncbi:hypothetical protein [Streptosporangium sp. CA-115845]|uniref:hypothetical protein n=1 Tax=Streptosporangium sp. CA-115845 TaxID=3240071 RepID=UPI003D9004AC
MAIRRVSTVVAEGDRRASLKAIRDKLARELHGASGRDAAVIAKELRATISELDGLPGGEEVNPIDDLAAQRARRIADAQGR